MDFTHINKKKKIEKYQCAGGLHFSSREFGESDSKFCVEKQPFNSVLS